jgi:hypothetical protein
MISYHETLSSRFHFFINSELLSLVLDGKHRQLPKVTIVRWVVLAQNNTSWMDSSIRISLQQTMKYLNMTC